ncbi:MAG: amidohydrolase family protein [Dehalococcoidia bacterium]
MSDWVLRGARVWDGVAVSTVEADVVVDGAVIGAVGSGASAPQTIDVSGATILPGLIEAHAHLCFNAQRDWRQVYDADTPGRMMVRMAGNAQSMLRAGITTVRDLGAPTALAVELRDALRAGLATGPDLLVAGAPITTTGGHCYFIGGEADGALEVRTRVREFVRSGVDWIKIMATGGNMTPGTNTLAAQFRVEELQAAVEEAHRLGRKVTAHCHGTEGIRVAVDARVDGIEHCSFNAPGAIEYVPDLIAAIAEAGIVVSPTVSVASGQWADTERLGQRGRVLRGLLDQGARMLMSTDCGIPGVPHDALAGGMKVLRDIAGLSDVETLKLATSRSAELLGLGDRGTIEAGKRADLLVVDGDPTQDLTALTHVRLVVAAGKPLWPSPV